jgi:biopolymer transport protein ExbB/TolQ
MTTRHGLGRTHMGISVLLGAILYVLSLLLLVGIHRTGAGGALGNYLMILLFERGIIPQLEFFAFWVGVSLLVLRLSPLLLDRRVLEQVRTALDESEARDERSPRAALAVLDQQPQPTLTSTVTQRLVHRAKTAAEPAELDAFIDQISDLERRKIEGSHEPVRYIIFLIPTLGFTGTVLGISDAVLGFSQVVGTNAEASVLQRSLLQICTSLGISFDTTLIALVLSAILALIKAVVDRAELQVASEVDDMAITQLRPVLEVHPSHASSLGIPSASSPSKDSPNPSQSSPSESDRSGASFRRESVTGIFLQTPDGCVTNLPDLARQLVHQVLATSGSSTATQPATADPESFSPSNGLPPFSPHPSPWIIDLLEAKAILAEQVARHIRETAVRREDLSLLRESLGRYQSDLTELVRSQTGLDKTLLSLVESLQHQYQTRLELDQRLLHQLEALHRDGVPSRVRLSVAAQPDA